MRRLLLFFSRHPYWTIATLLVLTLLAATQLRLVEVYIAAEDLLVRDDPERAYFNEVRDRFGDDRVVLLYVADDRVLRASSLQVLRDVIDDLVALPYIERAESLFSVPWVRTVDGYLTKDPYLHELPQDEAVERALLDAAARNPFLRNVLLAADGNAMAVALVLAESPAVTDDLLLSSAVDSAIDPLRAHYREVFAVGFPQVRAEIASSLQSEQLRLVPWAVAALLLSLFLLLRQLLDIMIPVLTAGISIVWTFGLMGLLGIPLNVVTSIVPLLLIIVGSTEDIHLLSEFRRARCYSFDTPNAIGRMAARMGRTVLFTFITTFFGFLSIALSGIEALWQFGIIAAAGLFFNFVATITLIPAALRLFGGLSLDGNSDLVNANCSAHAINYWKYIDRSRRVVLIALIAVSIAALGGIPRMTVEHNPIDSLARDSTLRTQVEKLSDELSGMESFVIVIEAGIQDTFLKARYLKQLAAVQAFVEHRPGIGTTASFGDYLGLLNAAFQELPKAELPASDEIVTELMIFLDHAHVSGYVSEDYSSALIRVQHDITSTAELKSLFAAINDYLDNELDKGLSGRISGDSVMTVSATEAMIQGQFQSILLLLLFFVTIISVIFTDLRVGLLAAIPNTLPVIVLFGVMGFADIPLNIGTTMAAAIAIGLAVDDTLHFMLRYNYKLKAQRSQHKAMYHTINDEALPVLATSIALIAGFLVFALSAFEPVAQFGVMSALVIFVALIADFIVTPLLISSLRLVTLWDLLSSHMRREVIPKSVLFAGMRPWEIRRFIASSDIEEYGPGETIFRIDDPSNELYFVMKGRVRVSSPGPGSGGGDLVIDEFGSGDLFGDVALLAEQPRQTDAKAVGHTTLLVLTREAMRNAISHHPFMASHLFFNLATDVSARWIKFMGRIQKAQGKLANRREK